MSTAIRATVADLAKEEGKAELINGRIVCPMPSGDRPIEVGGEIFVSLRQHSKQTGRGIARSDGLGYVVPELSSGRESFCPDASYYFGLRPLNRMRFVQGAPAFAAEVRSENDFGPEAEQAMTEKRADYFEAGILVVWDVDPVAEVVRVYRSSAPQQPTIYQRGDVAEAEPAVPGWRIPVSELFS